MVFASFKVPLFSVLTVLCQLGISEKSFAVETETDAGWLQRAFYLQRMLDRYSPMSKNHLIGTHNSYNSEFYRKGGRYLDPQQKLSITGQLNQGARFIELDVHWTLSSHDDVWRSDFLLCHGSSKLTARRAHLGCSFKDLKLVDALDEIVVWLDEEHNREEVIIFYIEDHAQSQHDLLNELLEEKLADRIYPSGGCKPIPDDLSKDKVLDAGKQIVFWKDDICATNTSLANLAFFELGNLRRVAEDRTGLGTLVHFLLKGKPRRIKEDDIFQHFAAGANIVNLDDLRKNDSRMHAAIWSWDVAYPKETEGACVLQTETGRWQNETCDRLYYAACFETTSKDWALSNKPSLWNDGEEACQSLNSPDNQDLQRGVEQDSEQDSKQEWVFKSPTNYIQNQKLKAANKNKGKVWLNYSRSESQWRVGYQLPE